MMLRSGVCGVWSSMRARRPKLQTRVVHYIVANGVCFSQQRIFLVFFLTLPTNLLFAILYPPPHQKFCPLSSSFRRIFIFLHRSPLVSLYFKKTSPVVNCYRRVIKVNRNISVFFPRCRETFQSGFNPTACLRRHNSISLYVRRDDCTMRICTYSNE